MIETKIKILNIITSGVKSEGISNAWLTYCRELNRQGLNNIVDMHFGVIDGAMSDLAFSKTFDEIGYPTVVLPNRLRHPIRYTIALNKILRVGKYNVVHANGSSSFMLLEMIAAFLAPTVKRRSAHSRNTTCSNLFFHRICWMPFQLLCNTRFACGKKAGKWLFGNRKFTILPNGKDLSAFCFDAKKRTVQRVCLNLVDKFVIGHVGTFTYQKNHQFLIDVFEQILHLIPNAHLYLVGEGPLKDEVVAQVKQKGLLQYVTFAGTASDMPDRLQAMDLMIFPSRFEGLPNVVLEWQAAGLPCVISDVITDECAVSNLVQFASLNQTPREWAQIAYSQNLEHQDRAFDSKMGCKALKTSGFDIGVCANKFVEGYKKLLNR